MDFQLKPTASLDFQVALNLGETTPALNSVDFRRPSDLVISALNSRSSGPCLSPGQDTELCSLLSL